MRETPGANTYGPGAWEAEAAQCRAEGIPVPDRARFHSIAIREGWRPLEPLHKALIDWYTLARYGTKAPAIEHALAQIEWPWCSSSLQEHVAIVAHHFAETERIELEERSTRRR